MKLIRFWLYSLCLLLFCFSCIKGYSQTGIGIRFASDFSHFFEADQHDLVDGGWSNIVVGPFFRAYKSFGGVEVGTSFLYKNPKQGGFNLPLVMNDFRDGQNVGLIGVEGDFKCGPRFSWLNPKFGLKAQYFFLQEGWLEEGSDMRLNKFMMSLPIGATAELPTGYGSVGFGIFYEVGLTNVIHDPDPKKGIIYDGSKLRSINVEITVLFSTSE